MKQARLATQSAWPGDVARLARSFLLASIAMHCRDPRADGPTVVLDLLAFDPNGTLGVLAETSDPKGEIGGLDSHARLKDATLRAAGKS